MTVEVSIDSVETEDAVPASPPNRISKKPTKELLTFEFSITSDGPIRAWRARLEPLNRNIGTLLGRRGIVCGSGDRCGTPDARSLDAASGASFTETTEPVELGEIPDGEYEVDVFAMSPGEWSA